MAAVVAADAASLGAATIEVKTAIDVDVQSIVGRSYLPATAWPENNA